MTTITITRPAPVAAPRGALWAASAAAAVLRAFASRRIPADTLAREAQAERQAEAAKVRRLADQWHAVDPRFAADLYAAADRHEV
jgi:hypothetical protein